MRIAEVATLATPVSRFGSGSIEAIVWHLAKGLVARGHDVTVFGAWVRGPSGAGLGNNVFARGKTDPQGRFRLKLSAETRQRRRLVREEVAKLHGAMAPDSLSSGG